MPYFKSEDLTKIKAEAATINIKWQSTFIQFTQRSFTHLRAWEFANQGFSRRLKTLVHCFNKVYETIPLELEGLPTERQCYECAINIQAFVFNVFGSLDNLAWIWVEEKQIKLENGEPLPVSFVGLGKKNTYVRNSLSADFQAYLKSIQEWFDGLEEFRHALAHRIPLYIPPYRVDPGRQSEYLALEERMRKTFGEEYHRLSAQQKALGVFYPVIAHSLFETGKQGKPRQKIFFHPQLVADLNTIIVLGQMMLEELDR